MQHGFLNFYDKWMDAGVKHFVKCAFADLYFMNEFNKKCFILGSLRNVTSKENESSE